jgi:predicted DNA-binding ribbon-helix-helix protein
MAYNFQSVIYFTSIIPLEIYSIICYTLSNSKELRGGGLVGRYRSVRINKGNLRYFEKLQRLADKKEVSLNNLINEAVKEYTSRRENI